MDWKTILKQESEKEYFKNIINFLIQDGKQYTIYPQRSDVFNAFKLCPLDRTKVIILGMDPYHGEKQAHGLAFSVLPECSIPPSLRNIFQEINSDLQLNHKFSHGCLTPWAHQGVLLLNTIMTVRKGQPNAHQGIGWETFSDQIITALNDLNGPLVFLLWGSAAKSKKNIITNPKHLILESVHPSPLSAYRGFFGCKHFSKTNQFLINNNIEPIDWLF